MDIDLEKEKARYIHKLEIRKLIIDKMFLGVIILAIGFVGNMYFETYRSQLSDQRFEYEKKLEAINAVRSAFAKMYQNFNSFSDIDTTPELPKDYGDKFNRSIDNVIYTTNSVDVLLSPSLEHEVEFNIWIYTAFHYQDVAKSHEYRDFASYLFDQFMESCKIEVGKLSKHSKKRFQFEEWPWEKTDSLGSEAFLDANFNKWKTRKLKL